MNQVIISEVRKFGNFVQISGRVVTDAFDEFNSRILKYVSLAANTATLESHAKINFDHMYLVPNTRTSGISRFKVLKEKENGRVFGKLIDYGYDIEVPIENVSLSLFTLRFSF